MLAALRMRDEMDKDNPPRCEQRAKEQVEEIKNLIKKVQADRRYQKIRDYKAKHRQGKGLAKASYQHIKEAPLPPVTHLPVNGKGSRMTSYLPELHKITMRDWNQVYNRWGEGGPPGSEEWLKQYQHHFEEHKAPELWHLPEITGADLKKANQINQQQHGCGNLRMESV